MPVTSILSDTDALTLTAIGDFPVSVARLWEAWVNPRKIECFWGPPQWPATFIEHDVRVGGMSRYFMTGPEGQTSFGMWFFDEVEEGHRFVIRDCFSDEHGTPVDTFPTTVMEIVFLETPSGSRFVQTSRFASVAAMEQLVAMGMVEGLTVALSQMDDVLADLRSSTKDIAATLEVLDETHVRVVRTVRGSLQQVWRAHHDASLMKQWLLGPDGWTMPVCEVAVEPGQTYRYEWKQADGDQQFGFTGELLQSEPPRRAVTTEQMIGMPGPGTINELLLAPAPGGRTEITVLITYPSQELRDIVLSTGMVEGMETSYARLERVLAEA